MVVGWSLERAVVDGLVVKSRVRGSEGSKRGGEREREWKIMAVRKRDEVFNALLVCCTGGGRESRKWECI